MPNVEEGFDVNPPIRRKGRNNGSSKQRDEIEELRRQVAASYEGSDVRVYSNAF